MAHSTVRFAAGASVVAASLMIVGPNPAQAVADKHGSGPHSNTDSRKNGSGGQGGNAKRRRVELGERRPRRVRPWLTIANSSDAGYRTADHGLGIVGSDSAELFVVQSSPDAPVALRSAAVAEAPARRQRRRPRRPGPGPATRASPSRRSRHRGSPSATAAHQVRTFPDRAPLPRRYSCRTPGRARGGATGARRAHRDRDQHSAPAATAAAGRAHPTGRAGGRAARYRRQPTT